MPRATGRSDEHSHRRAFVRFALVGLGNTLVFYAVYLLLHLVLAYWVANLIAQVVALCVAFLTNAHVAFRVRPTMRRALLYPLSNFGALGARTLLVFALVEWLHVSTTLAPLVAVALVMPGSYLVTRLIMLERTRVQAHRTEHRVDASVPVRTADVS